MVFVLSIAVNAVPVTVYQNDYNSQPAGAGFVAWNWGDNGMAHTAVYEDWGTIVVQHVGSITNTGDAAVNCRFGSKWDLGMSGNTSANPADYTISFDVMSVKGEWDPINLELFIVTSNPEVGAAQYGRGSGAISFLQAAGWVHVELNLAALLVGWWQGQSWDLTQSTWSIEVGGPPYPGMSVKPGESVEQMWLFDNLRVVMEVPEPTGMSLLSLGALAMLRKCKQGILFCRDLLAVRRLRAAG